MNVRASGFTLIEIAIVLVIIGLLLGGVLKGQELITGARVRNLMSRPVVVPDSLRLDPLLQLLRSRGMQMAVVADEYGDQAGIVTLEDVIEELVGEIRDAAHADGH